MYVGSPREVSYRNELRRLPAAAYGLLNSNAKRQVESNSALFTFGLKQLPELAQLPYGAVAGTYNNLRVVKRVNH